MPGSPHHQSRSTHFELAVMEGLTYCARNSFGDSFVAFEEETHPETLFETLEIRHGVVEAQQLHPPAQPPFHKQSQQSASQLCTFYSERDPSETVPQLKLVHIQSRRSSSHSSTKTPKLSLKITKRLFNCLFDQLQANPWVLWLISSEYDGLHHIMAQNTHADTYFFGSFHGAIIWTFSPATAFTRGLLISRHISSQRHSFYSLLSSYSPHLFTPYVPLMAATLSYILDYDERLSRYASDIAHVEKGTGFSSAGRDLSHLRFDVDALATWSRASSDVQINIINILRHHENCMRALGVVRETHTKVILDCPNAEYKVKVDKSMTEISASIHVLKMRATSFVSYATYLKNRAEAQITVVG